MSENEFNPADEGLRPFYVHVTVDGWPEPLRYPYWAVDPDHALEQFEDDPDLVGADELVNITDVTVSEVVL